MAEKGFAMRRMIGLALIALAGVAFVAAPAEAAPKKKKTAWVLPRYYQAPPGQRVATQITVRRRSYLDAGTEVFPDSQNYNDYVFPPNYSPSDVLPSSAWNRSPLPRSNFELGGFYHGPSNLGP